MNILFISGSYPPIKCGVGDYSYNLVLNLSSKREIEKLIILHSSERYNFEKSNKIKHLIINNWYFLPFYKILKIIKGEKIDVIHIQYPSLVYKYSLSLHIFSLIIKLCLRINIVITFHEFSQTHILRKIAEIFFIPLSDYLIFTNLYEQNYVSRIYKNVLNKSCVIKIGSNIPENQNENIVKEIIICFFGLIRPNKGLEEFIELVRLASLKSYNVYKFVIIGSPQSKTQKYYIQMREFTKSLPVIWKTNLSPEEVSKELSKIKFAYLLYPDGVSERRSSFFACLSHNILVFTNKGKQTPDDLSDKVVFVNSTEEVLDKIKFYNNNPNEYEKVIKKAKEYIKEFSWSTIAESHINLYKKLLRF